MALTEALVRERDSALSAVARLESELVAERETKSAAEARAEASRQKAAEAKETRVAAEGMVMDLRGSLGLLETAKDDARSELHGTQRLWQVRPFLSLLSLTSGAGSLALGRHEPGSSLRAAQGCWWS
jgi:hypothetical protein